MAAHSRVVVAIGIAISGGLAAGPSLLAENVDRHFDSSALPAVPDEFEITEFAREPLVRQPGSMAFDTRGRLFVGMGPQYRHPKPETPGDSVVLVIDLDRDGIADKTQVFASGFNAVQGLAWHGRDLWVANAPDLTVVRDLDGDDEADEYVKIYTDLGNLEHGLHGLNWAPDGKLYMSKGNSKGLTKPNRLAPKPFRELWGVNAFDGAPDFPEPISYRKGEYTHAYHDPKDDWGLEGGILRCDDGGQQLEIISRGLRNPWDIAFDGGFNWIGTDNDQTMGDRVFMAIHGGHMGWNHPWSAHWTDASHPPTAPISGPLFEGSGTGIAFCDSPHFPPEYRNVFFVNDWLRKTTFLWKPEWDGALLRSAGHTWTPFIDGGSSLYRPTDIEVGPDGALWILGWSSGYGAEFQDGEMINEGRIFRVACKKAPKPDGDGLDRKRSIGEYSTEQLIADLADSLPVRRIDAQDELARRKTAAVPLLIERLGEPLLSEMQQTWIAWTLGRMPSDNDEIDSLFASMLGKDVNASLNLKVQALRILAHRNRQSGSSAKLPMAALELLRSEQPRLRLEAIQALRLCNQTSMESELLSLLERERDPTTFYVGWKTLQSWAKTERITDLLVNGRDGVRRAALLALLEGHSLRAQEVRPLLNDDDAQLRAIAGLWMEKAGGGLPTATIRGRALQSEPSTSSDHSSQPPLAYRLTTTSQHAYRLLPQAVAIGAKVYTDRDFRVKTMPPSLEGADLLQTANEDDNSAGDAWLRFEVAIPSRVSVAFDLRQSNPPKWLQSKFRPSPQRIVTEDAEFQLYTRNFPTGPVVLGGNTEGPQWTAKGNYFVILEPQPLAPQSSPSTLEQTLPILDYGDANRGEILFKHPKGAGCLKCHSLDETKNGFGPNLGNIGRRASAKHIVQSMLDPSAIITEGFNQQVILSDEGQVFTGVLIEESGLVVTLGLATGETVSIEKRTIESRKTNSISAMPSAASVLAPPQVADITAFLIAQQKSESSKTIGTTQPATMLHIDEKSDRLVISQAMHPIAEFVFDDHQIKRPYFANLHTLDGILVTRRHPPIAEHDATDHADMHPGVWLGFGDINGTDYWRNQGRIRHQRFIGKPISDKGGLQFSTESTLLTVDERAIGSVESHFQLKPIDAGWTLDWDSIFHATEVDLVFGDQEEMGFGVRIATPIIEKNGGQVFNSQGVQGAKQAWGKNAEWCDYSGVIDGKRIGITLVPDPSNFRPSWWHTRDYGLAVANAFGRKAMKHGDRSAWIVKHGDKLRLRYLVLVHSSKPNSPRPVEALNVSRMFKDH